jgi:ubiquinone/menaquinone biosynthesis C-methylase UbiE
MNDETVPTIDNTVDTSTYYEREAAERIRGEPNDVWRFRHTAKALPRRFESLLDVGCGEGCWLAYLADQYRHRKLLGIEVSPTRVRELKRAFPKLIVDVGGLPDLPLPDRSVDVVTCLEVIEHLPDWEPAVKELVRVARQRVVITVPYRENIRYHLCIHCHKATPAYGHLHTFSEDSFLFLRSRYRVSFARIPRQGARWVSRLYLTLFPQYAWLAVIIDV